MALLSHQSSLVVTFLFQAPQRVPMDMQVIVCKPTTEHGEYLISSSKKSLYISLYNYLLQ